jgi:hypothetical protein
MTVTVCRPCSALSTVILSPVHFPVRTFFHRLGRILIVLFCMWHMTAVAAYALPDPAKDRVATWIKERIRPYVRPYMYISSQWQQWNLFSPDPLRRVTTYELTAQDNYGTRFPLRRIGIGTMGWWRDSDEVTILRKIEESKDPQPILNRYTSAFCRPLGIPPSLEIGIAGEIRVLPKAQPVGDKWWMFPDPQPKPYSSIFISCENLDRVADILFL